VARYFFKQMVEGIMFMHNAGVAHRDLKPENILLTKEWKTKIADYGFASTKDFMQTQCGTKGFMAPEI
jgi:serine/threonine protein kinase